MNFTVGQRWISHTEAKLGLGIIADVSGRLITLSFPAAQEERTYARDNAPISRVIYKPGDRITTMDDLELAVVGIHDYDGLVVYQGEDEAGIQHRVSELELNCFVRFTTPQQRLFSGQYDRNSIFRLRVETLFQTDRLQRSPVRGLLGCRTSLLPHQVYIASEVAHRHAPRVLLADEVGLGKTIEAGMIVHQQLYTGMASRVLILVPPTLIHQWLVEMLRRFNLRFAIFDRSRLQALEEEGETAAVDGEGTENPFETEQLVLCSLDLLVDSAAAFEAAQGAPWDLLVVDEAHHLAWSEQRISPEYAAVEQLARQSKGVLLLTATPEQAGIDGHFARLRLLDPSRFYDLEAFRQEEAGYRQLNLVVQQLLEGGEWVVPEQFDALRPYLKDELDSLVAGCQPLAVDRVVSLLLDRFGTGRVLFRNTRAAIPQFPQRRLHLWPLPCPGLYLENGIRLGKSGLSPERAVSEKAWLADDPRVRWLEELIRQLKPKKILVICAHASTAMALEQHLHLRAGIRTAAFYEALSIVERDRAAAYFADTEVGAQVLVCSEIGSEGRNFQFAHHMVLFDLPLNPDLLEQRIGRLDRIGQRQDINIHVPYLQDTAQEVLFRWYNEGMGLFENSFSAGNAVFQHFEAALLEGLQQPETAVDALLADTRAYTEDLRQQVERGRDPLLELNSCNQPRARALIEAIEATESEQAVDDYLEQLFDSFGIEQDYHSEHAHVLRAGEHMVADAFPGLAASLDDGVTVTSHRDLALVREDMLFLSWEHPLVEDAMDFILSGEQGNAAIASLKLRGIAPGTLLVEVFFAVHCPAPAHLQLERYLSLNPVRMLLDSKGKDLDSILSHTQLNERCESLTRPVAQEVIKRVQEPVASLLDTVKPLLEQRLMAIRQSATDALRQSLGAEVDRLRALRAVNPAIRPEEIDYFESRIREGTEAIGRASLQAQALRLIVTTH